MSGVDKAVQEIIVENLVKNVEITGKSSFLDDFSTEMWKEYVELLKTGVNVSRETTLEVSHVF